jgi:hypothetical protein
MFDADPYPNPRSQLDRSALFQEEDGQLGSGLNCERFARFLNLRAISTKLRLVTAHRR